MCVLHKQGRLYVRDKLCWLYLWIKMILQAWNFPSKLYFHSEWYLWDINSLITHACPHIHPCQRRCICDTCLSKHIATLGCGHFSLCSSEAMGQSQIASYFDIMFELYSGLLVSIETKSLSGVRSTWNNIEARGNMNGTKERS